MFVPIRSQSSSEASIIIVSTLVSTVQTIGFVHTIGVIRAASSNKDEERPTYKRYHKATPTAYHRLLSIAPCGPYINSIKDDVTIVTSSSKGVEISNGLGNKGEANSSKE